VKLGSLTVGLASSPIAFVLTPFLGAGQDGWGELIGS